MKGKEAITPAERMRETRKRKEEEGWKQFNLWLSPEAQLSLEDSKERLEIRGYKPTMNEIINQCIIGLHPADNKDR